MGELLLLTLESLIFIVHSSIPPPQWLSLSDSTSKLPDSLIVLFIGPKDASTSKVNTVHDCSSGCLCQRWGLFHTLHFFNGVCFHRAKLWPTIPTRFHSLMFLNISVKKELHLAADEQEPDFWHHVHFCFTGENIFHLVSLLWGFTN